MCSSMKRWEGQILMPHRHVAMSQMEEDRRDFESSMKWERAEWEDEL